MPDQTVSLDSGQRNIYRVVSVYWCTLKPIDVRGHAFYC